MRRSNIIYNIAIIIVIIIIIIIKEHIFGYFFTHILPITHCPCA